MIVVGTNVLAYLYLPTDYTARTETLLRQDAEWATPVLWRSEFRNMLAGYRHRGQRAAPTRMEYASSARM